MDIAILIVGIIAALAAVVAAVFAYPAWKQFRQRPDLSLSVEHIPTSHQVTIRITNVDGAATATAWGLVLVSEHRWQPRNFELPGESHEQIPGGVAVYWQSTGSHDTIGPGLFREEIWNIPPLGKGTSVGTSYTLSSDGMEPKHGRIEISGEDPPIVAVT